MLFGTVLFAQQSLEGIVKERDDTGKLKPLAGANIIWKGTSVGTSSDIDGTFEIKRSGDSNLLIVSFIGYEPDTLLITGQNSVEVILSATAQKMNEVEVTGNQNSSYREYFGAENKTVITQKELQKAACCTLAESFETNPSVDVSFTDAVTGMRQIEMLGLTGTYTQTTMEALPYIRGLMSNVGLFFVPGTWIKAINVSKGVGSVSNGYESITGQIDIDILKPFDEEETNDGLLNLYGDNDRRFEGNFNYRAKLNEHLSSMTLLHASSRQHRSDGNTDSFMDLPTFNTFNVMQRWQLHTDSGWESQLGFQIVNDKKSGGTINRDNSSASVYKYGSNSKYFTIYSKTGYVFPETEGRSAGIQISYSGYDNNATFGSKIYDGKEKNIYLNLLYQTHFINDFHSLRAGVSYVHDEYDERFAGIDYNRTERIPGAFIEYTFKPNDELTAVAGLRGDNHNFFGTFFTPRFNIRYSPDADWVFRVSAGRGYRSSSIFTEYASVFASSRKIVIDPSNGFGYGLDQESAWNYGFNATHYFIFNYNDASISFDFYRTQFDKINIADLDSDPRAITFRSVSNGAYSNSFQAELNLIPFEHLSTRMAYRFIDSKQKLNGSWKEKPFTAKHRALFNLGYSTEKETLDDSQMMYDLTVQWFGSKRIPSTSGNPEGLIARSGSPSFALVNAQITRSFNELFDLYFGVENLFGFRQNDPIIDPANPDGQYFDASLIWGPVTGRMLYAGLRFKI